MKKHLLSLLLMLLILALLFPTALAAGSTEEIGSLSGSEEVTAAAVAGDFAWTLSGGVLTISGNGDMPSYNSGSAPWYNDRNTITKVIVTQGITCVGNYAFYNCSNLTNASLPTGLTSIGNSAFADCKALPSITIPDAVLTIKSWAFSGCTELTHVDLPLGLETIQGHAFQGCAKLTGVELPYNLKSLYCTAFQGCKALTSIEIPASLTDVPYYYTSLDSYSSYNYGPFYNSGLKNVSFENGTTKIAKNLFRDCASLNEITLVNSIKTIEENAFYQCTGLTSVRLSTSLTSIGNSAFADCKALPSITIPDAVLTIKSWAFSGCTELTHVDLPLGLETIQGHAFQGCAKLTGVELPYNLKSLYCTAFQGCKALTSIEIPASLTDVPYYYTSLDSYSSYNYGPFYNSGLKEISFQNGVTTILPLLFEGCAFEELYIPDGITTIGTNAFQNCGKLAELTLSDGVATVNNYAFYNCQALTTVNMADSVTKLGMNVFQNCAILTDVTMSKNLSSIGADCFNGCSELKNIWIPASLNSVTYNNSDSNNGPFKGSGLESFELETRSTKIPARLFYGVTYLREVTIPASIASVGELAFGACSRIERLKFTGNAPTISSNAFNGVTTNAYYPAGDNTWTASAQQNYGGTLTWFSYVKVNAPVITGELVNSKPYLYWEAVPGSATYEIYRSFFPHRAYYKLKSTADNSCTDTRGIEDYRTYYYKVLALDEDGNTSEYSNIVSVTVVPEGATAPVITTQPASKLGTAGAVTTFSVDVEGGGLNYQWYYKSPTMSTWNKAPAGRAADYNLTVENRHNGYRYYCEVSNVIGSVLTDVVTLAVPGDPDFVLPASLTTIETEAFSGGAFRFVQAGGSLTQIKSKAFANCPNLTYIELPASVKTIATDAFGSRTELTIIGTAGSKAETFANSKGFTFLTR